MTDHTRAAGIALAALVAGLLSPGALAESATYAFDPVHTRVQFAVSHAGFSQALGTVSGSTGTLVFDSDDWSSARVEVSVPLTRLDLGDAKWNTAALANNLLDGKDHPVATFVSTRVEPVDATHAAVHGTLTLHGVAQPATLQVTFNQLKRHPLPPFRRTAGFSATTTISRKAFAIRAWPSVIGDAVELRIEAEATRTRSAAEPDADAGNAPTADSAEASRASPPPAQDTIPLDAPTPDAQGEPPSDAAPAPMPARTSEPRR